MKKFLQKIFVPLFLVLTALPASAYDFEVDGLYYNIRQGGKSVEVTYLRQFDGDYAGHIIIPEQVTYNGVIYAITRIGHEAFSSCSSLTSVSIPSSVTSIGTSAFSSCSSLTSIEIPGTVTNIGEYVFDSCRSLTSIEIPNSVTSILKYTFYGCSSLTSIEIPNSVTSIGNYAFYSCSSLTSVAIPNSVTSIGSYAFEYCSSLTEITSLNTTPPWTYSDSFEGLYGKAILYVPKEAVDAYESTEPWSKFEKIVGITVDDSHINEIDIAGNGVAIRVVDGGIDVVNAPVMARVIVSGVDGRVVTAMYAESAELHIPLAPGIYLVKVGDTTTAKVLVK